MSKQPRFTFTRPEMAAKYADASLGLGPFDSSSGLFLAAPRRTGKSTFLRVDLVPKLESLEIIPIMVDLWTNQRGDPGEIISEGIKVALRQVEAGAIKTLRQMGLTKFATGGLTFDFEKVGTADGATISDAIQYLYAKTGRKIAIIVDEAQHALTSESGVNAIFALKAARDVMNQNKDGEIRLLCIFTGSNRDKLSNLVNSKSAPFFGAQITRFPFLDRAYTDAFTDDFNKRIAANYQFNPDDIHQAFVALSHRPEDLKKIVEATAFEVTDPAELRAELAANVEAFRVDALARLASQFDDLTPLQQAILTCLADAGDRFQPFTTAALADYGKRMACEPPSKSEVQKAIADLREAEIIWRPSQGVYVIDDTDMIEWLKHKTTAQNRLGGHA